MKTPLSFPLLTALMLSAGAGAVQAQSLAAFEFRQAIRTLQVSSAVSEVPAPSLPQSCQELLVRTPGLPSGIYEIHPDGQPHTVYCDMTSNGGGWTLVAHSRQGAVGAWGTSTGDLNLQNSLSPSASTFKFSDALINAIPKTVFWTESYTGYANNRYFSGTCEYRHTTSVLGTPCSVSFGFADLSGPSRSGTSANIGGLSDYIEAANVGFVYLNLLNFPSYGACAGNGSTWGFAGCAGAGTSVSVRLWVR